MFLRLRTHELLHDAVLKRVVADDNQSTAGTKQTDRLCQRYSEVVQLSVDRDSQRHERAGGRVNLPTPATQDLLHKVRKS